MKITHLWSSALAMSAACSGSSTPITEPAENIVPPDGASVEMVRQGRSLYRGGSCIACHGATGREGPYGPNIADDTWLHIDGSYASIIQIVTTGVPAAQFRSPGSQPQFEMYPRGGLNLTDDQVTQVAAYVWTLSHPSP